MQPTTTPEPLSTPGKYRKWERARPNGQSPRRYFRETYRRFVASLALLAVLTVAMSRALTYRPGLIYYHHRMEALADQGVDTGAYTVSDVVGYGTGPWVYGLRQPVVEQFAMLVVELATWPPVTVALAFATIATAWFVR